MREFSPAQSDIDSYHGVVSVLIPLYNHETTIERSLESVLRSTPEKIELVVSDDGSHDGSAAIATSWLDRNRHRFAATQMVQQPGNLGIIGNLNFLIEASRGEFVTALGSDDELTDRAIDLQRMFLESEPDKDFVFANVESIDAHGNVGRAYFAPGRTAVLHHTTCRVFDAVFGWSMPWGRLFARRAALRAFGPYVSGHSFEDRWSGLKIVETGRFGYLPNVVYRYRVRSSGTGTAGLEREKLIRDWWDVERRLVAETTGLLHSLLWIRVRSVDGSHWISRAFWLAIRLSLTASHRAAAYLRQILTRHEPTRKHRG